MKKCVSKPARQQLKAETKTRSQKSYNGRAATQLLDCQNLNAFHCMNMYVTLAYLRRRGEAYRLGQHLLPMASQMSCSSIYQKECTR